MRRIFKILACAGLLAAGIPTTQCRAQESSVSLTVVILRAGPINAKTPASKTSLPDASNVAVWLTPLDQNDGNPLPRALADKPPQLVQRHKTFEPHVLIVPVGT